MNQAEDKQWTLDDFWSEFIDPDQDKVHSALESLLNHIQKVDEFDEFKSNGEGYLNTMINQILGDKKYIEDQSLLDIFTILMKLIPQFSAKLPISLVPSLYNILFKNLEREGTCFFTILSNVIEETILDSIDYSPKRQEAIANIVTNKLVTFFNNTKNQRLKNLSLRLLAVTIETLPIYFTSRVEEIKDIINNLSNELCERTDDETSDYLTKRDLLATLSKVYFTIIKDNEPTFLNFLENLKKQHLSVYILAVIIEHQPQYFELNENKDENYSFPHYQDLIFQQIANSKDVEKCTTAYATFVKQCLETLSVLINKLSHQMNEDQVYKYIDAVFDFLNFGITENTYEEEDQDDSVPENNDDDDEPDVYDVDESWNIRVAAMKLSTALMEKQSNILYDNLFYSADDSYMPSYIINLIHDFDIGSKLEALKFLRNIIRHYKNDIAPEIIDDFEKAIISQIKRREKDNVLAELIRTLTFIIHDLRTPLTLNLSLNAIKNIERVQQENITNETLIFITNVLEFSSEVEIVKPIIHLINTLLKDTRPYMIPTYLTVVSKIYYYYYKVCKNDDSLKNDLDELNNFVLKVLQKDGESKLYAITTISVFVSCCHGLSTAQKSVDTIVGLLDENSVAKVSIGAIALISASESAQLLSKDVKLILEKLKAKMLENSIITSRSLCVISLLLHKKILTPEDCQDIVGILFNIVNNGDINSRLLSLKIISRINQQGCDSKTLCSLVDCITSSPLNKKIINEISELVLVSSKASLDNVKPFVDSLINKVKMDSIPKDESISQLITSNLALVIGVASSTNKEYGLSLISQFQSLISNKGELQVFALKCIGEIGSIIDLSSNNDLLKSIFDLVHDNDRNTFIQASETIGLMSVSSPSTILTKFLDAAKSDGEKFLTSYLFGIKSFVRKVNSIKDHIQKDLFDQIKNSVPMISDYLLSNANDDFKETALTVSECLSGLVGISFDYSKKLIEVASYISIRAICIYMEEYSSYSNNRKLTEKEKEEVLTLITQVDEKYDVEKPMLDYAIMLCVKFGLTKDLSRELYENGFVEKCISGTEVHQSHSRIKSIGVEQVTMNIGTQLKSTSLDCVELFIKSDVADQLDYTDISNYILISFATETLSELKQKDLDIMTLIASSSIQEARENAFPNLEDRSIADVLKRFDMNMDNNVYPSSVMVSYYKALISLLNVENIPQDDSKKIKKLLDRHQDDELLIKIKEENSLKGTKISDYSYFSNEYTSSKLMDEFYPEAASIFFK